MNRARRALIAGLLSSVFAFADSKTDVADVVTGLVTALAGDNVAGFFKLVDSGMPGYAKLRSQIDSLIGRAQVSSSISILENEGDDARRTMSLDWYVEIRSRGIGDQTEPRRRTVRCVMAKSGKGWKVIELDPAGLFD
jgi:hypothetical protein